MEKQLTPITNGMLVIVGAKPSNFDDKIRNHPQVVLWNSQEEHWSNKELPQNTKAVFFTRWVGHAEFGRIMSQARKRHITVFNHEGTGIIAKQVKELLGLAPRMVDLPEIHGRDTEIEEETEMTPTVQKSKKNQQGKLKALIPFLDHSKTHVENAKILMVKARELGIETTEGSLAMFSSTQRRFGKNAVPYSVKYAERSTHKSEIIKTRTKSELDVTIQMFDTIIKELSDMREFLVATVEENVTLKKRLETLKRALTGD